MFWLWFFARRNVYRPGSKRLKVLTFFPVVVTSIPVGIANSWLLEGNIHSDVLTDLASNIIEFGPEVMFGRAPLITLGCVIFGGFCGYARGTQAIQQTNGKLPYALEITVVATVHGL